MQKPQARVNPRPLVPEPGAWPGVSLGIMSALPVDPTPREDPPDPNSILRALPGRERETFLAEYRRAVDGAHDPAGWPELRRFLRLWAWRAIAVAEPGYYEAWERTGPARAGACCSRTRSGSTIPARRHRPAVRVRLSSRNCAHRARSSVMIITSLTRSPVPRLRGDHGRSRR